MGFEIADLRFILSAEKLGFAGTNVCTLGRLTLFAKQKEITKLLQEYRKQNLQLPAYRAQYFAEDVLRPLGFEVDSMDFSDYEGATMLHDLNQPVPEDFQERYDLVFDGGTLEHVYNFPTALQSAMKMVRVGGHLMLHTPANNQCGHGFYQFSPELFFRMFSRRNGFELLRIYMTGPGGGVYHVADPATVHGRVTLRNARTAMLMVHAKKISRSEISIPQQSDYVETWDVSKAERQDGKLKAYLRRVLSPNQIARISNILNRLRIWWAVARWKQRSKLSYRGFYIPVSNWDVCTDQEMFKARVRR